MADTDLKSVTEEYMALFAQRDLDRCVQYFADDAVISWPARTYVGAADVRQWHIDRFTANMQLVQVGKVRVDGKKVVIDVATKSDRLKLMGINRLGGRVTLTFGDDDKVERAKFGVRFQR